MAAWKNFKVSLNRFLMELVKDHMADRGATLPAPAAAVPGRFFWNTTTSKLYLFEGNKWNIVAIDKPLFDFDAQGDNPTYPAHDYIGLWSVTTTQRGTMFDVSCMIGIGIFHDRALDRHDTVIDQVQNALQPMASIPLYNAANGALTGERLTVIDGVSVLPMSKSDERPLQFLGVTFVTDHTSDLGRLV